MDHSLPLITTLSVGFGLALVLGFLAERVKLPAIAGYLLAGVLIGPGTPGFVADVQIAGELAEIGVMLLMFGVGLHFSLRDLFEVRKVAIPGAVVQILVATLLGAGAARLWGWAMPSALVFGLALSVASTVVLLKALERRNALDTGNGRIAIGWLIVEDLAMVIALVLLPPASLLLAGGAAAPGLPQVWMTLGETLLKVAAFAVVMMVAGRRFFPWLLWQVNQTGSRELFTLCVVAAALGIAFASAKLFGVSFALGAFFAGMVLRESEFSHRAAHETLPLRDAFAVLFFVSVGMLFEPSILVEQPLQVLAVVAIIIIGKSVAAAALVLAMGYPASTALTVSASLAQIGEFSFILAGLGLSLKLLEPQAHHLIVAGALISIALNPLVFAGTDRLLRRLEAGGTLRRWLDRRIDPLAELPMSTDLRLLRQQVVIVGYGRVGRQIAGALREAGQPFVVVEENRELVEGLRRQGLAAVYGNAAEPETLVQAHIANACLLVVATPEPIGVQQMVETARTLNPSIEVIVRSHGEEEAALLAKETGASVFVGKTELARAMTAQALRAVTPNRH